MRDRAFALCLAALAGCGGDEVPAVTDYALSGTSPLPERVTSGDRVRTLVVAHEVRAGADRRAQQCAVTALLFDATSTSTTVPAQIDTESGCRFYATRYESDFARQRWVCAGAIGVTATGVNEQFGFCAAPPTAPVYRFPLRSCGGIMGNGTAHLASMDEGIPEDALTDLNADVALPGGVTIRGPSELPTVTWPESGDLLITWTGVGATSAVVRLEPTDPSATSVIVCNARRNGTQRVPADMIGQAMLRATDTRVTVMAFRETTVTAENGRTYKLAGMSSSNLVLQGRRM